MKLTDIVTNPSMILNKVSYKSLPIIDDNGNVLNVNDTFKCKYQKESNAIMVFFTIFINANPAQLFEIEIEYIIHWDIDDTNYDIDIEEKMNNIDETERESLCYTAPSESSLLIANITRSGLMPPLIVPSNFISQ